MLKNPIFWLILALLFVIGTQFWIAKYWFVWTPDNLDQFSKYGDSFGILSSLFSGLAFAFLVWTAAMQRKELKETKEALKNTSVTHASQLELSRTQLRLSQYPWIEIQSFAITSEKKLQAKILVESAPLYSIGNFYWFVPIGQSRSADGSGGVAGPTFRLPPSKKQVKPGEEFYFTGENINAVLGWGHGFFYFQDALKNIYRVRLHWYSQDNWHYDPPQLMENREEEAQAANKEAENERFGIKS